jgi:intein/homing endonuclease
MMVLNKQLTEQILKLHYEGKNNSEISKELNIFISTVGRHLKHSINYLAVDNMSKIKKNFSLDENYFHDINTEEKAYWLGFLYADGYIYCARKKNTGRFSRMLKLTLHNDDFEHLVKFQKALSSDVSIKFETRLNRPNVIYPSLKIYNKQLVLDLIDKGCVQAKTHILTFPTFLDQELIRHFVRGYFDGDGCITRTNKDNNKSAQLNITGRKDFLLEIQKLLNNDQGLNFTKLQKRHKDRDDDILTLYYGGINVMQKIKEFLYKDSTIYLDRKYKKFHEWVIY